MKPSETLLIEAQSKQFIEALTSNQYGVIAELLASTGADVSVARIEQHVTGLTEGCTIENAYFEIVSRSSEREATVHICFDLGLESQMICLTFAQHEGQTCISEIEWGYPD